MYSLCSGWFRYLISCSLVCSHSSLHAQFRARMCLFGGLKPKFTLHAPFSSKTAIFGPVFRENSTKTFWVILLINGGENSPLTKVEVIIIVWITYIYYIHKPLPCVSDILNGAVFCFISVFCEFFYLLLYTFLSWEFFLHFVMYDERHCLCHDYSIFSLFRIILCWNDGFVCSYVNNKLDKKLSYRRGTRDPLCQLKSCQLLHSGSWERKIILEKVSSRWMTLKLGLRNCSCFISHIPLNISGRSKR